MFIGNVEEGIKEGTISFRFTRIYITRFWNKAIFPFSLSQGLFRITRCTPYLRYIHTHTMQFSSYVKMMSTFTLLPLQDLPRNVPLA